MGSFFLQQGLVISRRGQTLEYDSRADNEIYFEEPETGKRVTLLESAFWGELQTKRLKIVDAFSSPNTLLLPQEPQAAQFRNLADLPLKYQADTERKVTYINRLREAGITRGQKRLIADEAKRIAQEINDPKGVPGISTIQKWWRDLERNNFEVYAVISGHAHRKRGSSLDDDSERFLQEQIDEQYAIDTRPTAIAAYRRYCRAIREQNKERATQDLTPLRKVAERTFYARLKSRPQKDLMISRFGREAARRHYKMIKGHLPANHPLDAVEIDHTPLNLYVLDDISFLPLGRPWATAIKDRHTGVLLGFYISFQATGLDCIFGAIKHSLTSHHLAYDLWPDIENPWPSFGRGHYYVSDRGGDFRSPRYRAAIVSMGALYEYCERRTPWLKGSIERFFLTLEQTFFESVPGRTFANLEKRGDYNPIKDAVVRFSTLIYLLHKWAADFHNILPNRRKQARPLDLWNDGIGLAPPPYPSSTDELNIILGQRHSGTLCQEGLRFEWLTYAGETLSDLMDVVGKGTEVDFVVSGEDLGHIYVLHPRTGEYLWTPCTRPEYASGLTQFQHKYLRKEANVRLTKDTAVDMLLDTQARIQETLQGELAAKNTATKARLARVAGINSNAVLAGEQRSVVNPFANTPQSVKTAIPTPMPTFTNVRRLAWGA
jgi:putative transposase